MDYLQAVVIMIAAMFPQYEHCSVNEVNYLNFKQPAFIVSCETGDIWIQKMISPDYMVRVRKGRSA